MPGTGLKVFSNASLALLLLIAAAAFLQSSPQFALLTALIAVDPLLDVWRYTSGKRQRGFVAFVLEVASAASAMVIMAFALLYLSYTYLPLALLLLSLAALDASISIQEAAEALASPGALASPYLE
ncbi:MAG: hypothetical protein ABWK00_05855 [Desulfurococcaceae archaeon]